MRRTTLIGALAVYGLFLLSTFATANARPETAPPQRLSNSHSAFTGTAVEAAAMAMPTLLSRAGYDVEVLDLSLSVALEDAFGPGYANTFLWTQTLVFNRKGYHFSMTLPARLQDMERGVVALGILSDQGTLERAFRLEMADSSEGKTVARLFTPEGALAAELGLADEDGRFEADLGALALFAKAMDPELDIDSGVFDPIIEILNMILDALYMIKEILNMAICAVSEAIEYFTDLNYCFPGSFEPGGGAFINLVICSIESTIAFIEEVIGSCL